MSENIVSIDFNTNKLNKTRINKKQIFADLLNYGTVTIMMDARGEKIQLPEFLLKKNDVRLNMSYEFNIPDFGYNDKGTWATLSFASDGNVFCFVEWDCVYAMLCYSINKFVIWKSSIPADIDQETMEELSFLESISEKNAKTSAQIIEFDFSVYKND